MKCFLVALLFVLINVCVYVQAEDTIEPVLQDRPYELGGALTLESVTNLHGGVKKGSRELANLDLTFALNTAAAGWWGDGEWFVYVLGDAGKNPSDYTGDLQGISNIAADEAIKIYEFWYQHSFADDHIKVLVGLHDYNSTFYSLESAGLFTHSSFGIGSDTSQVGPSIFPTTATALHLSILGDHQYLLAAIYDGISGDPNNSHGTHIQFNSRDGLFNALEWGFTPSAGNKLALGLWSHTAEVNNPVNNEPSDNNHGIYLIAEKTIHDKAAVFLQLGHAAAQLNQLASYAGAGVTFNNFWQAGDGLGIAVAHARNGDAYVVNNPNVDNSETAWELTYYSPLLSSMSIQPSIYYIKNPSMDKTLKDALAIGTRFSIQF